MFCSKCGIEINDDAEFCPGCGTTVKRNSEKITIDPPKNSGLEEVITALDKLDLWIKVLLCILAGSIIYGLIYRIAKGNILGAIIMFILYGFVIGFVIDLVTIIQNGKPTFLS